MTCARCQALQAQVDDLEFRLREIADSPVFSLIDGLTRAESIIVNYLKRHTGTPITREALFALTRKPHVQDYDADVRSVDSHISRARRKNDQVRQHVRVIYSVGYVWDSRPKRHSSLATRKSASRPSPTGV